LTYPLYLIHGQIGFIVFQRLGDRVGKYLLLAGTTVAMAVTAYLINRLVERPLAPVLTRMLGSSHRGKHR
jgi:peptidoglycan/LPS O-acetylase OafA/YrhL